MGLAKTTAAVYLLAFSALSGAEVTTTSTGTGTGTSTKAIHSITTTTTTTSRTITHTSATSPAGKTSTSTESVPGVTHIPDSAIILSIVRANSPQNNEHHDDFGDDLETLFIKTTTPSSPHLTPSCASASAFNLTSGRLSRHEKHVATNADVVFQPLGMTEYPSALEGAMGIDTVFSVEDGYLRWYNERFYGGRARYCWNKGMVEVVFHISKTWPEGCEEVDVRVFREGECRDGEVVEGERIGEIEEGRKVGEVSTTGTRAGGEASATAGAAWGDEL
ncbi:hypothetical protein F4805DRAFT_477662 [Annulohypoxylon moriforme]|nr:hypothetical protein F4805DRAFT_477662 [Annulohypoxylon moriforme]